MKKLIKNFITSSPFLYRKYINLKNYFSTKNKLKNSTGQIKDDQLKNQLIDLISKNEVNNIVEIGTWNGLGSTTMLLNIVKDSNKNINFYSIESDLLCFKFAKKNLKNNLDKVKLILGRVHDLEDLHYVNKNVIFDFGYGDKEYEWFIQDLRRYKKIKNVSNQIPNKIDLLLLDGGEFSGYADFLSLYLRSKFIVLDDCNSYKQHNVLSFIQKNSNNFQLIYDSNNRVGLKIFHHLRSV
jgi:hypothetical protein